MEKKYEQFKLKWMLEHGHTLKELIDELEELREESDPDETLQDIFDEWEFGYGFGSEIWPCYEEYLDCEGAAEEKGFLEQELDYIVGFAVESCFDNELACQQLRSLWTAYCFHRGLDVDTEEYDAALAGIWKEVSGGEEDTAYWSNFDSFDQFMSADLA